MTEYFVRNGDMMTHIVVLVDPVYLTEPLVKSEEFIRSAARTAGADLAVGVRAGGRDCRPQTEGDVPAYLPGEHPFKDEFATTASPAGDRRPRRRRDDVSGVPGACCK